MLPVLRSLLSCSGALVVVSLRCCCAGLITLCGILLVCVSLYWFVFHRVALVFHCVCLSFIVLVCVSLCWFVFHRGVCSFIVVFCFIVLICVSSCWLVFHRVGSSFIVLPCVSSCWFVFHYFVPAFYFFIVPVWR